MKLELSHSNIARDYRDAFVCFLEALVIVLNILDATQQLNADAYFDMD